MREFNSQSIPKPPIELAQRAWPPGTPLDLEIGAGQGLHAVHYSLNNPNRTLIALERTETRFKRLSGRVVTHGSPENLYCYRADAIPFITHFINDDSLGRVFLLFPNPYPKSRQRNLRWYRHPFMQCLERKLAAGGTLHLATNMDWYAKEARADLITKFGLQCVLDRELKSGAVARTHFERKYLSRGETVFDLVFQKGLQ